MNESLQLGGAVGAGYHGLVVVYKGGRAEVGAIGYQLLHHGGIRRSKGGSKQARNGRLQKGLSTVLLYELDGLAAGGFLFFAIGKGGAVQQAPAQQPVCCVLVHAQGYVAAHAVAQHYGFFYTQLIQQLPQQLAHIFQALRMASHPGAAATTGQVGYNAGGHLLQGRQAVVENAAVFAKAVQQQQGQAATTEAVVQRNAVFFKNSVGHTEGVGARRASRRL